MQNIATSFLHFRYSHSIFPSSYISQHLHCYESTIPRRLIPTWASYSPNPYFHLSSMFPDYLIPRPLDPWSPTVSINFSYLCIFLSVCVFVLLAVYGAPPLLSPGVHSRRGRCVFHRAMLQRWVRQHRNGGTKYSGAHTVMVRGHRGTGSHLLDVQDGGNFVIWGNW